MWINEGHLIVANPEFTHDMEMADASIKHFEKLDIEHHYLSWQSLHTRCQSSHPYHK